MDAKQNITELASYDLSYFDFKDGLKYTILYDKEIRNYWKSNFIGLQIDWDYVENLTNDKSYSDYCNIVRDKPSLVTGFGSGLLESTLNNTKWSTISEYNLTEAQRTEWKALGKKIFSWTCCSQKRV